MTETIWTVNTIRDAVRATGSHWFDPDTMRAFGTRVLPSVYQGVGGIYFVTSDHDFDRTRKYSVRRFDPTRSKIDTVGEVASYATAQEARTAAKAAAQGEGGEARTVAEEFRPVTVLAQFLADLRRHGREDAKESDARSLMELATSHHKLMEDFCNGFPTPKAEQRAEKRRGQCEGLAIVLAAEVGAAGVQFSGDPRGATMRLRFADGATNDFGRTGWIVPAGDGEDIDD